MLKEGWQVWALLGAFDKSILSFIETLIIFKLFLVYTSVIHLTRFIGDLIGFSALESTRSYLLRRTWGYIFNFFAALFFLPYFRI